MKNFIIFLIFALFVSGCGDIEVHDLMGEYEISDIYVVDSDYEKIDVEKIEKNKDDLLDDAEDKTALSLEKTQVSGMESLVFGDMREGDKIITLDGAAYSITERSDRKYLTIEGMHRGRITRNSMLIIDDDTLGVIVSNSMSKKMIIEVEK